MSKNDAAPPNTVNELELVFGAGGVQGPVHIGVLRCLEERQVPIGMVSGASVGALIAAFVANGYDSKELKKIFLSEEFRYPSFDLWSKCLRHPPLGLPFYPWGFDKSTWANQLIDMYWPWVIDFKPWLRHVVSVYGLRPQANLRIVACDFFTRKAVAFEGSEIDLVDALHASTAAISGLGMRPVWYDARDLHSHGQKDESGCDTQGGHLLIDGFYYHPIPAQLARKPAIVSKIGFATQLPSERLSTWDLLMHMREMGLAPIFNSGFPDPEGHFIIESGLANVATTNFGVSTRTLEQMVEHGYKAANERLALPDFARIAG